MPRLNLPQNWGDQPFVENVESWFWGHGRLGPYSIVWFDLIHPNGTQYLSAYVAQNGTIVSSQCDGIQVQSMDPEGLHIDFDLGDKGVLGVNVTDIFVTLQGGDVYTRSLGRLEGGLHGTSSWKGVSQQDEFRF